MEVDILHRLRLAWEARRLGYPIGAYTLGLGLKVPVYQHIVTAGDEAGQLSYPAILDFSIERGFDLDR